jgi:ferredoxin--NADP+ reductase
MAALAAALPSSPAAKAAVSSSVSPPCFLSCPSRLRNASRGVRTAQVSTTETAEPAAPAPVKEKKISKKQDEGVVTNKYRPKEPYVGRCLLNTRITGDNAPGETWHMVFSTEGTYPSLLLPRSAIGHGESSTES